MNDPLLGRKIERKNACAACGSVIFTIEDPRGPHAHHLRCDGCGRGGIFLPRAEAEFLRSSLDGEAA
jgi:hypothetical protein